MLRKKNELLYFLQEHDVDIALISETKLRPKTPFNLSPYEIYRTDRPANPHHNRNPGGGTAVMVHRRLVHRGCVTQTKSLETTGVYIHLGGMETLVIAAYLPPMADLDPREFDGLFNAPGPVLLAGDFNAKHRTWHSQTTNRLGRLLIDYLDQRPDIDVTAPDEPTHYPDGARGAPDVIDFALHKDLRFPLDVSAVNDLPSDHLPIVLTLGASPSTRYPPTAAFRTDWKRFHQLMEDRLPDPDVPTTIAELDGSAAELQEILTSSVTDSSNPAPPRSQRKGLPPHIQDEKRARNIVRARWRRTRCPAVKHLLNQKNRLLRLLVDDYRTESWGLYLESLEAGVGGTAWKAAKQLRGSKPTSHPLQGHNGMAYSAQDRADLFADTMHEQFQVNHGVRDVRQVEIVGHFMTEYFREPPEDDLEPFTLQEVTAAIRSLKPRKAPGLDRISPKALQASPPEIAFWLLTLFNSALRLRHFPASWKLAKIILFPKPGKSPINPQNHRPISLLPVISKMFERLFLSRLSPYLDDFIRPEQFGFRRGHSSTLQLVRLVNSLVDNHNKNLISVSVLLDVSKAFDKVWHEGLLLKLSESPIPTAAVHLIRSYLSGRSFRTSVEGELSTRRSVQAGVPQGSVLGPVLYLVYTNDMPTTPGVTLSLYADDALFHCRSANQRMAATVMQRQMDALSPWLKKWRVKVNADKSDAIIFRRRRKTPRQAPPAVSLDGVPIQWKPTVKYLGVTLDSRLSFTQHAAKKVNEGKQIAGLLGPLLNRTSPLKANFKVSIFLMIVRAVMLYSSEAWWALLCKTGKKKMEAVQSKALRRIYKQPWFVRNETIRDATGVPTMDDFTRKKSTNLFQKARESPLPHIAEIARRYEIPEDGRPRPIALLDDPP